ncbi:hypothetical protein [Paraclostridium bifermentans]|uniref:hypothetical protein n=1 Tax=Paraclostridium bifermentans TaxID=1490 RepID=UPI00359C869C
MKKKLLSDVLIYLVTPIILCSLFKGQHNIYSIMLGTMLGIGYTMIIKYNQNRFNLSGIVFLSIYIMMQSGKLSLTDGYSIYVYNIYCLLFTSIFIIVTNLFDKNIFKQIYTDILKISNYTQLQIANIIKKNNLYLDFYKITSIVNIHILSLVLVKSHAALSLGKSGYSNNLYMEGFVCTIFFIIEIVFIVSFVKRTKQILSTSKIKTIKFVSNESKIINFHKYKNLNK